MLFPFSVCTDLSSSSKACTKFSTLYSTCLLGTIFSDRCRLVYHENSTCCQQLATQTTHSICLTTCEMLAGSRIQSDMQWTMCCPNGRKCRIVPRTHFEPAATAGSSSVTESAIGRSMTSSVSMCTCVAALRRHRRSGSLMTTVASWLRRDDWQGSASPGLNACSQPFHSAPQLDQRISQIRFRQCIALSRLPAIASSRISQRIPSWSYWQIKRFEMRVRNESTRRKRTQPREKHSMRQGEDDGLMSRVTGACCCWCQEKKMRNDVKNN